MHPLAYLLSLIPGLLAGAGLFLGGAWAWATPVAVFVLVPLADALVPRSRSVREAGPADRVLADGILYLAAVLDLALVVALWLRAAHLDPLALGGSVFAVGIVLGMYALNVGHELGHRGGRTSRGVAQILMASSLYAHFWVEHNLGHHVRVATPDDPASARRGEWVYPFWIRSIVGGARSALALSPRFVIAAWAVQAAVLLGVGLALGPWAALAWVGASAVGILLLETVNYLEHYGLRRQRRPDGRWERVAPRHSWNAEHPVGRAILFDLPRHADHHAHPRRRCVELRPFEQAPELPAGYPAMVLAALVPPLFMALLHPRLDAQQTPGDRTATATS